MTVLGKMDDLDVVHIRMFLKLIDNHLIVAGGPSGACVARIFLRRFLEAGVAEKTTDETGAERITMFCISTDFMVSDPTALLLNWHRKAMDAISKNGGTDSILGGGE